MGEEEKSSKFLNAIERYAKEQLRALESKFKDIRDEAFKIAEVKALKRAYDFIREEMVKMHKKIDGEVSRFELQNKRIILKERENIKNEVFLQTEKALLKVTKDENVYLKILKKSAQEILKVLDFSGTIFYVKQEDIKYTDYIKEVSGRATLYVKPKNSIVIGGIVAENRKRGIVVNETLDEKLKLQTLWFMLNSGLKIKGKLI